MRTIAFTNDKANKRVLEIHNNLTIPFAASCGVANGYVAVPKDHPLYGLDWDDERVESLSVHGGITYANEFNPIAAAGADINFLDNPFYCGDWWVFGFDTLHCDDNIYNWNYDAVVAETRRLQQQLEDMF